MECPYCDGKAAIKIELKKLEYRKETFCVNHYFYKCEKCENEFTTREIDEKTLTQLYALYRAKNSIPFVEEIIAMRQKYDLPAAKMNEILNMGANSYANFEKGDMPSPAFGSLLLIANNPVEFKKMIARKMEIFSSISFKKLNERIDLLIQQQNESSLVRIDLLDMPCSSNGFKTTNFKKIGNLVCLFLNSCKSEFNDRLKLNKLLFYTDFLNFKEHCSSITGLSYRAVQFGPIPSFYLNLYTYLENEHYIESSWKKNENGGGVEIFKTDDGLSKTLFSDKELQVINFVIEKFKDTPSWDLVTLSHKEEGWKECYPNKDIIDYQRYAINLKLEIE